MPTRLISVLTNGMDTAKPDVGALAGEQVQDSHHSQSNDKVDDVKLGISTDVKERDGGKQDLTENHSNDEEMKENETDGHENSVEEEQVTEVDLPCDIGEAECPSGNEHIVVDTVIVRDSDSVSYRNQESPKEDHSESDVHINVQTMPSLRNDVSNSPVTGGTESKRNRTSRKSSKKDKPSPFKKKDSLPTKEILNPNSPTPLSTDRCDSSLSSSSGDVCRICQCDKCEIQLDSPLVAPCLCSGSLKYIHQACLQKWIKSSDKLSCELCQFDYCLTKKTKPFREWERLDMTPAERRKVICSVTFHIIAITCVVWSLYVLIDRTTEEVEAGTLLWPFWTKLIVVAIGFTGGVVFMYVQCKMYLTLCKKWRMYNKVIIISSISESQREKANQQGILRMNAKQAQLEEDRPNLNVFNIVNETESV